MSSGGYAVEQVSTASGTVTSVGLSLPASLFSVSGSPVVAAGTLTGTLIVQNANKVLAGPASGADAVPTFRVLVAADIPDLSGTYAKLNADNVFTSTGYQQISVGTTAQRPGSPGDGMIRFNSTTGRFEFYNGSWTNYVKLAGDTMTGDLTVPNVNVNTAVKLLDTINKIALDVSTANQLRIGNGFTSVLSPNDLLFASAKGIQDANGVYLVKFPASVASAVNYYTLSNAATGSGPVLGVVAQAGTNIAGADNTIQSGQGTGTGALSYVKFKAPQLAGSGTTIQSLFSAAAIGFFNTSGALWLTTSAPSGTNYSVLNDGSGLYLSGANNINFRIGGATTYMSLGIGSLTLQAGVNLNIADGNSMVVGTTNGLKIGTATNQKLGLWNTTPIVQPTTAIAGATRVGGGGTNLTDTDTFDGYTLAQVVRALKNFGLLQ